MYNVSFSNNHQNIAFKGTVKNSEYLEKAMQHAKERDLKKFNKLLDKVQHKNKNWEYSLQTQEDFNADTMKTTKRLNLVSMRDNRITFHNVGEETIGFFESFKDKCYNNALKKVTKIISKEHIEAEKQEPRKSLINKIIQKING